jgi:hypothetical protein
MAPCEKNPAAQQLPHRPEAGPRCPLADAALAVDTRPSRSPSLSYGAGVGDPLSMILIPGHPDFRAVPFLWSKASCHYPLRRAEAPAPGRPAVHRRNAVQGQHPAAAQMLLAAVINNTFFGDGQAKGGLGEMPSASRRDTVPCMHSGESGKCGNPSC